MPITKTFSQKICSAVVLLLLFSPLHAQQYGWKIIARPTSYRLYVVDFVDALHGWCAGKDTIYRTIDGGKTWKSVLGPTNADFNGLSFIDQLSGWAVGNFANARGLIWKTSNGGISWLEQISPFNNSQRRFYDTFAQSLSHNTTIGSKYFIADTGITVQTTNGGATWQERILADSIAAISKITFIDQFHGWALGGLRNAEGILLRTSDGGKAWEILKTPRAFTAISFIDSLRGWASWGGVHYTLDGGMTWNFLGFNLPGDFYIKTLSFVDTLKGWVFGSQFYQGIETEGIYSTKDGGKSWAQESIGLTGDFGYITDAVMLDQNHGWAVSYDGAVLSYQLMTSAAEKIEQAPKAFMLKQNYPNPFNPTTNIQYSILKRSPVILRVFDGLGRVINTLVDEIQEPGTYRVSFDGAGLASGTYFYKLEAGEFTATHAMNLLK